MAYNGRPLRGVRSDGQTTDHSKRRNYTAARADARRPRTAAGDHPRLGRARRPAFHRILYRDHPQPEYGRAKGAGLPYSTCCHTFRATGITAYLQNGGTLEHAQQIAAHESPRTTKLYDRTRDEISLDEVERIKF